MFLSIAFNSLEVLVQVLGTDWNWLLARCTVDIKRDDVGMLGAPCILFSRPGF